MVQLKSSTRWIGLAAALLMLMSPAMAGDVTDTELTTRTWTTANSPYVIIHDVTIPAGEVLTIEPGVTVEFDGPYSMTVNGVLNAQGQPAGATIGDIEWVTFTQDTTGLDDSLRWQGIRFVNSDPGSVLRWVVVEHGYAHGRWPENNGGGLYVYGSSPHVENAIIRNCRAYNNGGGVYFWSSSSVFRNNIIADNHALVNGGGMYAERSELQLRNLTIVHNNSGGTDSTGRSISGFGNGVYVGPEADLHVRSTIFWNNGETSTSDQAYFVSGGDDDLINVRYCIQSDLGDDNVEDFLYHDRAYFADEMYYTLTDSSVGVDTGEPSDDRVDNEPAPHGQFVNMGAWGGTQFATTSVPVAVPQAANGDRNNFLIFPTTRVEDTTSTAAGIGNIGHDVLRFQLNENTLSWLTDSLDVPGVNSDAERLAYIEHRFTIPTSGRQFEIAPDSSDAFDVHYHPDANDTVRVDVWLLLETEGGDIPYKLRGTPVNPGISISTNAVDYGTVALGDSIAVEFQISSTGTTPLLITTPHLETATRFFSAAPHPDQTGPWSIPPGQTYTYLAICDPSRVVGELRDSIFVRNSAEHKYIRLSAFLEGPILETDVTNGDTLDFLFADVNSDIQRNDVVLYNAGNHPMTVSEPGFSGTAFSTDPSSFPLTVPAEDSLVLSILFDPDSVQMYEDQITIPTDLESIHLYLTGRGITGGRYFSGSIPNPAFGIPEVWGMGDDTLYICAGPTVIETTEKLTILDGVTIQFEETDDWIRVEGTLEVLGTADNKVLFTTQGSTPYHGGVRFFAASQWSRLEHVVIEKGHSRPLGEDEEETQPDFTLHGGGVSVYNSSPTFYDVTIRDCYSSLDGGAMWMYQAAPTIVNCTFENNSAENFGGAITIWGSQPEFHNNIVRYNSVVDGPGGGIYMKNYSDPTISNSLIQGNTATYGGGMNLVDHCSPVMLNSILYGNVSTDGIGHALYAVARSNPIVRNSVVHGHGANAVSFGDNGGAEFFYSVLEDSTNDAQHVFDADPAVVFQDTVDFVLTGTAAGDNPLIDGGNPAVQYEDYSFPPSKGTETGDIGLYGGPGAGYWDSAAPLRIRFLPNLVNARTLYIVVSTLESGLGMPTLEVTSYQGTDELALTEVSSGSGMYRAQYTTDESNFIEVKASSGEYMYRTTMAVTVFKPGVGGLLSDPSGASLELPPNAATSELMLMAEPDLGGSLPDEVPMSASAGARWEVRSVKTQWAADGEIVLPYDEYAVLPGREDGLAIWRLADKEWRKLDSYVDVTNKTVHAGTDGPGVFAVINSLGSRQSQLLPTRTRLGANYPNPFNPTTTIPFELANAADVQLQVYNLLGQLVATVERSWYASGRHSVMWDGRNQAGAELASGVYFYRLIVTPSNGARLVETRKLVLMR